MFPISPATEVGIWIFRILKILIFQDFRFFTARNSRLAEHLVTTVPLSSVEKMFWKLVCRSVLVLYSSFLMFLTLWVPCLYHELFSNSKISRTNNYSKFVCSIQTFRFLRASKKIIIYFLKTKIYWKNVPSLKSSNLQSYQNRTSNKKDRSIWIGPLHSPQGVVLC